MRIPAALIAALLLIQGTVVADEPQRSGESSGTPRTRPNILFIVSDDHGWGDLPSNWDKTEVQLPTLESLAAKGVRFPNYHTVPLCGPSRACMFTGQFSTENGMWRGPGKQPLGSPGYRGIKRDVKMLSEYLSEAGYKTGAFGKWHMGSLVDFITLEIADADDHPNPAEGDLGDARSKFNANAKPIRIAEFPGLNDE